MNSLCTCSGSKGHVISCAMNLLGMPDVGDVPQSWFITSNEIWMLDDTERRQILVDTATEIIEENVYLLTFYLMVPPIGDCRPGHTRAKSG